MGGIGALGPRQRWKPSSAPTLPGEPPPRQHTAIHRWAVGWGILSPRLERSATPSKAFTPGSAPSRGEGRRKGRGCGSGQPPRFQPSRMWPLLGSTILLCPVEERSIRISLEAICPFLGHLPSSPSSLTPWVGQTELKGPVGQTARPPPALTALWCLLSQRQLGGKREDNRPL